MMNGTCLVLLAWKKSIWSSAAVVVDIENIQLGWLKLEGGRDWHPWPNNDPMKVAKPSDAHGQGFSVMFYSTKLFDDEPVRELSASGAGIRQFVQGFIRRS